MRKISAPKPTNDVKIKTKYMYNGTTYWQYNCEQYLRWHTSMISDSRLLPDKHKT